MLNSVLSLGACFCPIFYFPECYHAYSRSIRQKQRIHLMLPFPSALSPGQQHPRQLSDPPPPHLSGCLLPRRLHSLLTGLWDSAEKPHACTHSSWPALLPVLCPCGLTAAPATLACCLPWTRTKHLPPSGPWQPADSPDLRPLCCPRKPSLIPQIR